MDILGYGNSSFLIYLFIQEIITEPLFCTGPSHGCWGHETYSLLTGALRPVKMHPDNHLVRVLMEGNTTL